MENNDAPTAGAGGYIWWRDAGTESIRESPKEKISSAAPLASSVIGCGSSIAARKYVRRLYVGGGHVASKLLPGCIRRPPNIRPMQTPSERLLASISNDGASCYSPSRKSGADEFERASALTLAALRISSILTVNYAAMNGESAALAWLVERCTYAE